MIERFVNKLEASASQETAGPYWLRLHVVRPFHIMLRTTITDKGAIVVHSFPSLLVAIYSAIVFRKL